MIQWDIQGRPEVVGHVAVYNEDVFPTFQNLETLLRAIEPLAQVLDARPREGQDRRSSRPAAPKARRNRAPGFIPG